MTTVYILDENHLHVATITGGREVALAYAAEFFPHGPMDPYHLDIAGPAFMESAWNYWPQGGTGVGVRLFYQFLKDEAERKR